MEIPNFNKKECQRRLERFVMDRKGFVAMYAETLLTREDLYEMFCFYLANYDEMRKKYNCEKAFPHMYDKISSAARN